MHLNSVLQYATLFTMLVALGSVAFAILSHRWQTNATIYLNISERLHAMYGTIPDSLRAAHLTGNESQEYETELAAATVLNFLNLVNTAFVLYRAGYFSGRLWKALSAEAEWALRLPVSRVQWAHLKVAYSSNPRFVRYVDKVQSTG